MTRASHTHDGTVSILIETANLATAELSNLAACLESLERQTHPIRSVTEVVVLVAGDASTEALAAICRRFEWVTLRRVAPGTGYGDLKAMSGAHAESEIIILCDADCRYEPSWLEWMLRTFDEREDVQIVSGETTTPIEGPYGLAVGLTFVFPRYSSEDQLVPSLWYWANNVAVRRSLFERIPLPSGLPLGRGQNVVHANLLRGEREMIWRQPRARAVHELPLPSQLISRYVLFGYDMVTLARLVDDRGGRFNRTGNESGHRPIGRVGHLAQRARSIAAEDPRRLAHLPLAVPVAFVCIAAYTAGMAKAYLRPPPVRSPETADAEP